MAPFLVDPISTYMLPSKRKITTHFHSTTTSSGSKLSTAATIAIIVGVAVVILAIAVFAFILKRRRSRDSSNNNSNTMGGPARGNTFPGYSADAGGGLYGGTPGAYAGGVADEKDGKHSVNEYGSEEEGGGLGGGDYGRGSMGGRGYRGVETGAYGGGGEAAGYYAQSYGRQSQDQEAGYSKVGAHEMPQRPPMAFNPSPAQI